MHLITDSVLVLCSVCIGTVGGYALTSYAMPEPSPTAHIQSTDGLPYLIEVRGVIRSYDAVAQILYVTALNPWDGRASSEFAIQVDERTRVVYGPDIYNQSGDILEWLNTRPISIESLHEGMRIDVFLGRSEESLFAAQIRVFGRE